MTRFWAQRGDNKVGPYAAREEAPDAFRRAYPFNGPDYMARAKRNEIITGYGLDGPWFDGRWHPAREVRS